MSAKIIQPRLLEAIQRFTTCDIGDALIKLGVPHGGYLSGLKMFSAPNKSGSSKICGPAHIVRMVHASDKSSSSPTQHFADSIVRGSVVFISQPKGLISACWGGLMSTRASKLRAAGVVIDGRFRDTNEHQQMGMGLFARGPSILGSHIFTRSSEINVPVTYKIDELPGVNAVTVHPGDIIMDDADGVVAIPVDEVADCVELCTQRADIDEKTLAALRDGNKMGPTIRRLRE